MFARIYSSSDTPERFAPKNYDSPDRHVKLPQNSSSQQQTRAHLRFTTVETSAGASRALAPKQLCCMNVRRQKLRSLDRHVKLEKHLSAGKKENDRICGLQLLKRPSARTQRGSKFACTERTLLPKCPALKTAQS